MHLKRRARDWQLGKFKTSAIKRNIAQQFINTITIHNKGNPIDTISMFGPAVESHIRELKPLNGLGEIHSAEFTQRIYRHQKKQSSPEATLHLCDYYALMNRLSTCNHHRNVFLDMDFTSNIGSEFKYRFTDRHLSDFILKRRPNQLFMVVTSSRRYEPREVRQILFEEIPTLIRDEGYAVKLIQVADYWSSTTMTTALYCARKTNIRTPLDQ